MAAISPKHPLESAQEHIPMCEKHNVNIDITCEDCDEFICSQCAKTDHKDHDWKTIPTAGSLRRRELKKTLGKVKDIYVIEMNEMMQTAVEQMEKNQKRCEFEVSKLQKHFEAIVSKLDEIRKNYEKKLRGNLESKNSETNDGRLNLEKKKEQIMDVVDFIEEKHSTMSDYSLIDNLRDLTNLLSNRDRGITILGYPLRYEENLIKEDLLKLMMGDIVDLNDITVIESDSFHIGTEFIDVLAEFDKDILVSIQAGEVELLH
ncbi:E3 ubiquitin-protein ligase TRIM38-like [Magallana gigas]|uniref:E3 ubiquitin-protein ligase TRIM38-like n=1 Tax=Magallana gigas TaxID=29159 RepID=UPI00333EC03B